MLTRQTDTWTDGRTPSHYITLSARHGQRKAPSIIATMSTQHFRTLQVERFFRQCRMLLRQCCRFRQQCRTKFRPFDNVQFSICFDVVKRTKFYNRIVRHCCRLWQQSRILLRQSRTLLQQCCLLLRHCCWCGRGLKWL